MIKYIFFFKVPFVKNYKIRYNIHVKLEYI